MTIEEIDKLIEEAIIKLNEYEYRMMIYADVGKKDVTLPNDIYQQMCKDVLLYHFLLEIMDNDMMYRLFEKYKGTSANNDIGAIIQTKYIIDERETGNYER